MDFQQLMNLASQNQMKAEKKLPTTKKYSTQVSAPKKLAKVRVESETLKKLREEKVKEKVEKEKDDINDHITRRIKEQKEREDARRNKKVEKTFSKVHQDKERVKVRNEKQIEKAKERRENIDEKNLTPKMREKLKEERLREKLREIKLKDKQEIQPTTEGMTTAESKKEGFKIPKSGSDGPKSSSVPNEKSVKTSSALISAGARPLYKINVSNQSENSSKPATKKPVTKGPPPLDFNSLMKLASQKASDPKGASSSSSSAAANSNFRNLSNRPMTQEEKERHQRMSSKQFKEWYKYGTSPERSESPPPEKPKKDVKSGGDKVRKKETTDTNHKKDKRTSDYSSSSSSEKKRPDSMNGDSKKKPSSKPKSEDALADKYKLLEQKYKALEEKLKQQQSIKEKNQKPSSQKSSSSSSNHTSNSQNKQKNSSKYASENNNLLICRPAEKAPEKPKSAWDRIYDQIQKESPMKKPVKRKRVIDSEEEEEEEMADFIDDEPLEDEYSSNYSKCIREIFGYDRRRFQYYEEDDDDDMETSYAQQMKEEIRSTKIGILEDLEDIRLEKEQKKKKAKLKN